MAGGLASRGARVRYAGVITTPGVAYLTRTGPFVAGVMISASHNPYQDNGIKVFGHNGFKLPDDEEHLIEQEIFRLLAQGCRARAAGACPWMTSLSRQYLDFLLSTVSSLRLDGVKVVIDCGNGAASRLAPELFRRLGAEVVAICCAPDGRNINLNCGALHVEGLQRGGAGARAPTSAWLSTAMPTAPSSSRRAARSWMATPCCWSPARALKAAGRLAGDIVVSTVMSNLGLEKALEREGIRMLRTPVGDKYVLEEMVRLGAALGGEQSGHVIFREYATTGDGMLTALRLFEIARNAGVGLDELTADLKIYPQLLVNIRVREKKGLLELPAVAERDPPGRGSVRRTGPRAGALLGNRTAGARDGGRPRYGAGGDAERQYRQRYPPRRGRMILSARRERSAHFSNTSSSAGGNGPAISSSFS